MRKPTTRHRSVATPVAFAIILIGVLGAGCQATVDNRYAGKVLELGAGSSLPNFGSSDSSAALLSWVQPGADGASELRVARVSINSDETLTIGDQRVLAAGSDWFLNWADYPEVLRRPDGTIIGHFLQKNSDDKYAYGISIVADSAKTKNRVNSWREPIRPHRDSTAAEHGFVSLLNEPEGATGVVWLDGRNFALTGSSIPPSTQIRYVSIGTDGQLGSEIVLDERTCDCCQTDATILEDGDILIVYRDRSAGNIRDISFVQRTAGKWSQPQPVARDGWEIDGCPVQGPSVDSRGRTTAVAWFTATPNPAVRVAFFEESVSGAPGRFKESIVVDSTTALGRVSLVIGENSAAAVAWLAEGEAGTTEAHIRAAIVSSDGTVEDFGNVAQTSSTRASGFPQLTRIGDRFLLAWTDVSDEPTVKTMLIPAPFGIPDSTSQLGRFSSF